MITADVGYTASQFGSLNKRTTSNLKGGSYYGYQQHYEEKLGYVYL